MASQKKKPHPTESNKFIDWYELVEKEFSSVYTFVISQPIKSPALYVTIDVFINFMIQNLYSINGGAPVKLMKCANLIVRQWSNDQMKMCIFDAIQRIIQHSNRIGKEVLLNEVFNKEGLRYYYDIIYKLSFESFVDSVFWDESKKEIAERIFSIIFSGIEALIPMQFPDEEV